MKANPKLDLANRSHAEVVVDSGNYTTAMTGNSRFSAPAIVAQIAAVISATTALSDALKAPTSDTKTDDINIARAALDYQLDKLAGMVADVANEPTVPDDQRVAIVHSAHMDAQGHNHPQKHTFTVKNTEISGTVHLTAEGGDAVAHEWEHTYDILTFLNRVHEESTSRADTYVEGLTKKAEVAFFHKPIIAGRKTVWEGPIFLVIT